MRARHTSTRRTARAHGGDVERETESTRGMRDSARERTREGGRRTRGGRAREVDR